VNSPQLTVIGMIRLIGYGNIFYVSPADKLLDLWKAQIYRIFQIEIKK